MSRTSKNRSLLILIVALIMSVVCAFGMQVSDKAFANETTKTIDEVTFTMETGASIYNKANRLGIKFAASMSESDYGALTNNVGEGKEYKSIKFGVVIAPASYEDVANGGHGAFNEETLFGANGKEVIYDWAIWDEASSSWVYNGQNGENGSKIRVVNIESTTLSIRSSKAYVEGSITTIRPENLLNEFKGVAYIIGEKNDGTTVYSFANENDNDRTAVYVAQQRQQAIKEEISELDEVEDADYITELNAESNILGTDYITDEVKATDATYTVEHYYAKPGNSGHFLYETTTETGKINETLSADSASGSEINGVDFDEDNENNASSPVIFAQDKSIVKVYYDVIYGVDADDEKVYDVSATEDYKVDEGITAVYSADMVKISNTDGKITNKTIVDMGKGEHTLYVLTENGFEEYSTIMATHVIETGEEFISVLSSYKGMKETTTVEATGEILYNYSAEWYIVLVNDIDCGGGYVSRYQGADRFWGTFNGLGHSVFNVRVNNAAGIFGTPQSSNGAGGVIKNTAFEITATAASDPKTNVTLLVYNAFGDSLIDNVYVKGYYNGLDDYAGVSNGSIGNVTNSIFDISYSNSTALNTYIINGGGTASSSLSKVYTIGENSWVSPGSNERSYCNFDSFFAENKTNITAENGFNKYWNVTDNDLYFGNLLIKNNQYVETWKYDAENKTTHTKSDGTTFESSWGAKESVTIDVANILGSMPNKVMLGGIELTITDGVASIDITNYSNGGIYSLLIFGENKIVSVPLMLVSQYIENNDEFREFLKPECGTSSVVTKTWYAVLANDLDFSKETAALTEMGQGTRFYGTIDGQGHYISNLTIDQALFGYNFGTIKNIAFVNVTSTNYGSNKGLSYGAFASQTGVVSNVYMSITATNVTAYKGLIDQIYGVKLENCVFDVNYSSSNTAEITYAINGAASSASANLTNVYFLGNADQIQPGDTTKPYEDGAFAQYVADGTILTAANGFNANWKVVTENGTTTVYFGNNVVDTYTATAE